MTYYVLVRGSRETFSMNTMLTEDEARRYRQEGEMVMVRAACVWTRMETLELFRMWLSHAPSDQTGAVRTLIRDIQAGKVTVLELSAGQLRDRLRAMRRRAPFVLVTAGPEHEVQKLEEFVAKISASGN